MESSSIGRPITVYDSILDGDMIPTKLYTGIFHGFGQDVLLYDGQWLAIQVCIVEKPDGVLDIIAVQYCKFEGVH